MVDSPRVEVRSRSELRQWLARNHATAGTHWLVTWRKPSESHLPYAQLVEELLCWGWIDSLPRALDADRTMLRIARRNVASAWSAVNKAHVERARSNGSMTAAGEDAVASALANGMWNFLNEVEAGIVPEDLAAAFDERTRIVWDTFPRSVKRGTLEWLANAKGAQTRSARILDIAQSAAAGLRPKPFRR